jgi:hypothetical protein
MSLRRERWKREPRESRLVCRPENCVRVCGRARIVRKVENGGHSAVEQAKRGHHVADKHVFRIISLGESGMHRRHILADRRVDDQATKLILPAVLVAVHQTGHDNHAFDVDDDRVAVGCRPAQISADAKNLIPFDQDIAAIEIAKLLVERDDRPSAQEYEIIAPTLQQRVKLSLPF